MNDNIEVEFLNLLKRGGKNLIRLISTFFKGPQFFFCFIQPSFNILIESLKIKKKSIDENYCRFYFDTHLIALLSFN